MNIYAKIKVFGYSSFDSYKLVRRLDNKLVWGWAERRIDLPHLKLVVSSDRIILGSFNLKFEPEDLAPQEEE